MTVLMIGLSYGAIAWRGSQDLIQPVERVVPQVAIGQFCFVLDPFADVVRLNMYAQPTAPGYVYTLEWQGADVYLVHGAGSAEGSTSPGEVINMEWRARNTDDTLFGGNAILEIGAVYEYALATGEWHMQLFGGGEPDLLADGVLVPIIPCDPGVSRARVAQGAPLLGTSLR
jgi:hypothetical protein